MTTETGHPMTEVMVLTSQLNDSESSVDTQMLAETVARLG